MKKKKIFEYFWNCSKRNLGKKVRGLYLLVLIEFLLNLASCSRRLTRMRLKSEATGDRQWSTWSWPVASSMLSRPLAVGAWALALLLELGEEFEVWAAGVGCDRWRCSSSTDEVFGALAGRPLSSNSMLTLGNKVVCTSLSIFISLAYFFFWI